MGEEGGCKPVEYIRGGQGLAEGQPWQPLRAPGMQPSKGLKVPLQAYSGQGVYKITGLLYTNKPGVIDSYFYQYIKRRLFRKKYLPYFKQLKELLKGKMANSKYTVLINNTLNKSLAQNNQKHNNISLFNIDIKHKKENKDIEYLNTPL